MREKSEDTCFELFKEPEEFGGVHPEDSPRGEVLQSEKHGIELFISFKLSPFLLS